MESTRRRLIQTTVSVASGTLLATAQTEQEKPELRGSVQHGKVELPPLHQNSEVNSPLADPEPHDQRMGVAVVGLGHLCLEQILPGFHQAKHVRLAALVSGSPEKAKVVAAQNGLQERQIYTYESFDRIKDDPGIDIVYIVLPNSLHAEFTIRAASAGKHVLCEKPMAVSTKECHEMIDACDKAGRELMIAYRMQYNRLHRELIQITRERRYGDIRFISAVNGQNDAANRQWRQIRSLAGGGSLPDVGIYCLNAFRYLTGEEPLQVCGKITQPKNDPRFSEVEDLCTFTLRFPSGILATGSCGYSLHENRHLRVMAADGWYGADPAFGYNNLAFELSHKVGKINALESRRYAPENQFAVEMDDFAQRLRRKVKPLTDGQEGLQDQVIIEAIYKSAASGGRAVDLPRVTKLDSTRGEYIDFENS
jgi:predicted dehydrogenase